MIDFDMLSNRLKGNKTIIEKILNIFISQYENFSEEIALAHNTRDCESIFHITHKLKGSSSIMCSSESLQLIQDIETTAKSGALPEKARIEELSESVASMQASIKDYLSKNS